MKLNIDQYRCNDPRKLIIKCITFHITKKNYIKCGNAWTARVLTLDIKGQTPRGLLKKTWAEAIRSDLREYNLDRAAALDRCKWKAILKDIAAMQHHTCH